MPKHSEDLPHLLDAGEVMRLNNRVALVTGASSGMRLEIARIFAEEGASVVAVARRKERLEWKRSSIR